jgi:hypothetical protein
MKFYPLASELASEVVFAGYKEGREIGKARLGGKCLYFRDKMKVHYIPYEDITRVFRRVLLIPAKMCCGKGDFEVENIVVCTETGEVAQIQLPGERAGKIMLEELARLAPHAEVGKPNDSAQEG